MFCTHFLCSTWTISYKSINIRKLSYCSILGLVPYHVHHACERCCISHSLKLCQRVEPEDAHYLHLQYAFGRRSYPKRSILCSLEVKPTTLCAANVMIYHLSNAETSASANMSFLLSYWFKGNEKICKDVAQYIANWCETAHTVLCNNVNNINRSIALWDTLAVYSINCNKRL